MVNYVPILRFKRGELSALRQLQSATRIGVKPYLDISGDRYRGTKATKLKPAVAAPEHVVEKILTNWGGTSVFVDAAKVASLPGMPHPIESLADAAAVLSLQLIPATYLSAPITYQAAVANVQRRHGLGVCLKVDLDEMTSASGWLGSLPFHPKDVDLIIDFSSNVSTVSGLGIALNNAFQALHVGSSWRSVTVSGTSLPENFSGYQQGTYLINRTEYDLWKALHSTGLPYDLGFGDYATIAVTTPPAGIAWGFPINAKYTLDDEFLICRGIRTVGPTAVDMNVQLAGHARDIVAHPKRISVAGCWADQEIDQIASGGSGTGNLEKWVKIGVNRHIERVRQLLP